MKRNRIGLVCGAVVASLALVPVSGCGKKDGGGKKKRHSTEGTEEEQVAVSGQLALNLLGGRARPTHVVGINTETNEKSVTEVESNGKFELPIEVNSPWVFTYVNEDETGADMLVSKFGSNALDTIAPLEDASDIALGTVDASAATATTTASASSLLADMGLSSAGAETLGAVDDIGLRYANPDVDNNGKIDALEDKNIILDFHNRFRGAPAGGGSNYDIDDMKNTFLPDTVVWSYSESGVTPELEKSWFSSAPTSYSWTFSEDMVIADSCTGMSVGATLTAGTACVKTFDANSAYNSGYARYQLALQVQEPTNGTYTLKVGSKTFTWTNIAVSDFSAGSGFIVLFLKFVVNDAEKLTGFEWKWQKKGSDGTYSLATEEELNLVVKEAGGYLSLKVGANGDGGGVGANIPLEPTGTFNFLTAKQGTGGVNVEGDVTLAQVNAGLAWSQVAYNPGLSYDDKLGMRFFFSF